MADVLEFCNVTRKQAVDIMAMAFEMERERAFRITQIADEFSLNAVPVPGGLFRVLANGNGTYNVEDHRS